MFFKFLQFFPILQTYSNFLPSETSIWKRSVGWNGGQMNITPRLNFYARPSWMLHVHSLLKSILLIPHPNTCTLMNTNPFVGQKNANLENLILTLKLQRECPDNLQHLIQVPLPFLQRNIEFCAQRPNIRPNALRTPRVTPVISPVFTSMGVWSIQWPHLWAREELGNTMMHRGIHMLLAQQIKSMRVSLPRYV